MASEPHEPGSSSTAPVGPTRGTQCVECGEPTDPKFPNSPYCEQHRKAARSASQSKSRAKSRAGQDLIERASAGNRHRSGPHAYSGPKGLALLPDASQDVRDAFGALISAATNARSLSDVSNPEDPKHLGRYRDLLSELIRSVEDFNEVLGPILYAPTEPRADGSESSRTSRA